MWPWHPLGPKKGTGPVPCQRGNESERYLIRVPYPSWRLQVHGLQVQGQFDGEGGTLPRAGDGCPELATVGLDNRLRNCQTQSEAAVTRAV